MIKKIFQNKDLKYFNKLLHDSWIALRPLSLTLAIGSTTLGIIAALRTGFHMDKVGILKIAIITIAGILVQSGANLINDYFEGSFRYYRPSGRKIKFLGAERTYFDVFVFLWGMACFGGAALIGIILIYLTNINMLYIGLIGVIGAYAYTGEPFVYKRKGLGVPLSFLLMGPLMVYGAYFPFKQDLSLYPVLIGLPSSLLIPALMLSNEMRDFKRDTDLSLGTLSVRIGSKISIKMYKFLIFGSYISTLIFIATGIYPLLSICVFATLPIAYKAIKSVAAFERVGIPHTNYLHWTFTLILIISLILV